MTRSMILAADAVVDAVSLTTLTEDEMLAVLEEARTRILSGRFLSEAKKEEA